VEGIQKTLSLMARTCISNLLRVASFLFLFWEGRGGKFSLSVSLGERGGEGGGGELSCLLLACLLFFFSLSLPAMCLCLSASWPLPFISLLFLLCSSTCLWEEGKKENLTRRRGRGGGKSQRGGSSCVYRPNLASGGSYLLTFLSLTVTPV